MSYSDDPNRESTTDQNSNSLLEMLPSGTATSAGTLDLSFMGAALPAVLRDDLAEQEEETGDEYYYDNNNNDYYNDGYHHHHHDDASRVSEVSHNSLRLSALNATLKRLSLQERFRIPQHLIDTLYADRIPTEVTQPVTADTAAALTTTPNELAAPPRPRLYNRALHPSRLASMSSGGTTTAYDGDDDSDAILRSRRSSDDNDGGSTLPSMGGTTASTRVGDGGKATATPPTTTRDASEAVMVSAHNHLPATTDPNQRVLTVGSPRKPPNSPARTGTTVLTQSPQSSDAVAAIIQSISEELYLEDPSSNTGSLVGYGGSSSAVMSRGTIRPSDTMKAVVGTSASLTSSNPQSTLLPTDTMQAVMGSSSSLAYSGMGGAVIRPSDTMQAVVGGTPSASTGRTSRAPPPPKVIPSPTAHVNTHTSGPSPLHLARSSNPSLPRYMSPTASSAGGQPIKLHVSPGRIPSYPIDLSDVDESVVASTTVASSHAPLHSFSLPEDRRKAIYVEAYGKQMRHQPSPTKAFPHTSPIPVGRRTNPTTPVVQSSGTSSIDVVKQARRVERSGSGRVLYVDVTENDDAAAAAGASITASSLEPDSDAAVMELQSTTWIASSRTGGGGGGGEPSHRSLQLSSAPPTPQQQRKLALQGMSVSGSSVWGGTYDRTAVTSLSSTAAASTTPVVGTTKSASAKHWPRENNGRAANPSPGGVTDHHTAPTPKASSSRPAPQIFFPTDNNKGAEEGFDEWLDSALATKTFDKTTSSDEEKEALDDWLDSVIS